MARTRGGLTRGKGRGSGNGGGRKGNRGAGRGTVGEEPAQGQPHNLPSPELVAMITQVVISVLEQRAAEKAPRTVESSSESGVMGRDDHKRKDFGESSSAKESDRVDSKRQNRGKDFAVEDGNGKGYWGELPKCPKCGKHHPVGDQCIECFNCKKIGHMARHCRKLRVDPLGMDPLGQGRPQGNRGACYECGSMEHYWSTCPQWVGRQALAVVYPDQLQIVGPSQTEEDETEEDESV